MQTKIKEKKTWRLWENWLFRHRGRTLHTTSDFSSENTEAKRKWHISFKSFIYSWHLVIGNIYRIKSHVSTQCTIFFWILEEKNCQPWILHPDKRSFRNEGGNYDILRWRKTKKKNCWQQANCKRVTKGSSSNKRSKLTTSERKKNTVGKNACKCNRLSFFWVF